MKKFLSLESFIFSFFFFLLTGIISLIALHVLALSFPTIIQTILILIVLVFLFFRLEIPKKKKKNTVIYMGGIGMSVLLIYLIILSTGGITSPFLIFSHLAAIAFAFLITPLAGLAFILASVITLALNIPFDVTSRNFVNADPFVTSLYFLSYIQISPFTYWLAREYSKKDEWSHVLEKQMEMFKTEEEQFLKNIIEAVIVVDTKMKIVYTNENAKKLSPNNEKIAGQKMTNLYTFKDREGRTITESWPPFEHALTTKHSQVFENVQILLNNGEVLLVTMIILPIVQNSKTVALNLIIREESKTQIQEAS